MQHPSTCSCSRRSFLRGSGLTLSGFGIASLFPMPFIQNALAGANSNRRLLFIFLRGGNDGLNACIPHGDPQYNSTARPSLFIPQAQTINLNGFAYLNPNLSGMMEAFDNSELAVVHRVGYQNNSRSHFDGQRIWENGNPATPQLFEGWLYRHIQESMLAAGKDLPVVTFQSQSPLLLRGEERFVNIATPESFDYGVEEPKRSKFSQAWRGVYDNLVGLEPYRPVLAQTGVQLVDILDEYASWDQANWNPIDPNSGWSLFPVSPATNQAGFSPESYDFFASLKLAALSLLESDGTNNGTRIAGTQLNGWDTHNGQAGQHAQLLSWLGYGFQSLRTVLSGAAIDPRPYTGIWDDTLVVTLSEFGRTTDENGNAGTDHAASSCMFMQGGTVQGGVYNCDPGTWPAGVMYGVDGRYLLERTDYRSIFFEILRDHMGADPASAETIFPGYGSIGGSGELSLING